MVLLGACNGDAGQDTAAATTTAPATPTTTAPATTTTAPLSCAGIGPPPQGAEITYVKASRLEAVAPDGTGRRCLLDGVPAPAQAPLAWGGAADRLLVPPTHVYLADGQRSADVGPQATSSWSRPTGTSVLAVGRDRHLRKHPHAGGPFTDISFLRRTDEAVYHPAGRHIAAVGVDHDGRYGITLATNRGENPRPLAVGETAERIHSLTFTQDGMALHFLADHGDRVDLHTIGLGGGGLGTLPTVGRPEAVVVSPFTSSLIAYQNACSTFVIDNGVQRQPLDRVRPIGFLGDGRLVVLGGCEGAGDIRVVGTDNVLGPVVVRGVEHVALRQSLPTPGQLPQLDPNPPPA